MKPDFSIGKNRMKLRDCLKSRGITQFSVVVAGGINPARLSCIFGGLSLPFAPERKRIVNGLLALGVPESEVNSIEELVERLDGRTREARNAKG